MSIEFLKIIENIEEKSEADIVRADNDMEETDNIRFDIDLIEAEFESFLGKDNLKCVAETRRYYAFPCDFTNKTLIKDVIHNKKKFSSSFYDKEAAKQQIIKALRNHHKDIAEWKKRNSSAHNYYEKTLTIKEQARDEKKSLTGIGWGITNKFEIYNTSSKIKPK